ncbi:MAG: DUF2141 domain-containing protein [Aetokthonos hydrillicola CCALA 1050]|jgi:uncharacterized protein (DUF2141 family)|nr:DUF2141 domain-containing protein [Aetokthonos hydrillicola CCALA 1050]MBW4587525.1 DUF2141 domain-containing protein [Aetokthonos hydrillicola CCALA 1050]
MQRFGLGLLLFSAFLSLASPFSARANLMSDLTVEIDGLRNRSGNVCVNVFASSKGFPNSAANALQNRCVPITNTSMVLTFKNLKPGSYSVAVLHDAEGDGKLRRNFLGIPTNGFGFSRNPTILTGPPKFEDSAIFVAGSNTNIQIKLMYLGG